jgi:hypothetical protein
VQGMLRFTVSPFHRLSAQAVSCTLGAVPFAESANGFKSTAARRASEQIRSVLAGVPDKMGP